MTEATEADQANSADQSPPDERFSLNPSTPRVKLPPRLVIHGEAGVGKTTLAACADEPIIIAAEDGAAGLNTPTLPTTGQCANWAEVIQCVDILIDQDHIFKTCAIDTINGVEQLCAEFVCNRDFGGVWTSEKGAEGYNAWAKGAKATAQELRILLERLDILRAAKGMTILLLAHTGLHKSGNALGEDYQKFAPDMDVRTWAPICKWADIVGHACREVFTTTGKDGKTKGHASATRHIIFAGGPGRDAKSRVGYEMPDQCLLDWSEIAKNLNINPVERLADQVLALWDSITPEYEQKLLNWAKGKKPSREALLKLDKTAMDRLVNGMLANRKDDAPATA